MRQSLELDYIVTWAATIVVREGILALIYRAAPFYPAGGSWSTAYCWYPSPLHATLCKAYTYTILSLTRFCLRCGKESHLEVRDRVFVKQGEWDGKQYEGETEAHLLGCTECGQEFIPY